MNKFSVNLRLFKDIVRIMWILNLVFIIGLLLKPIIIINAVSPNVLSELKNDQVAFLASQNNYLGNNFGTEKIRSDELSKETEISAIQHSINEVETSEARSMPKLNTSVMLDYNTNTLENNRRQQLLARVAVNLDNKDVHKTFSINVNGSPLFNGKVEQLIGYHHVAHVNHLKAGTVKVSGEGNNLKLTGLVADFGYKIISVKFSFSQSGDVNANISTGEDNDALCNFDPLKIPFFISNLSWSNNGSVRSCVNVLNGNSIISTIVASQEGIFTTTTTTTSKVGYAVYVKYGKSNKKLLVVLLHTTKT